MSYSHTWDETIPIQTTAANTLDQILRNIKIDIRERMVSLGISDWATDPAQIGFATLVFAGASPQLIGGTTSTQFRDATNSVTLAELFAAGDLKLKRDLTIGRDITIPGNSVVSGTQSIGGALTLNGAVTANKNYKQAASQLGLNFNDAGASGAALSVDWNNGNIQQITLSANCTLTLLNPVAGSIYWLRIVQTAGNSYLLTIPNNIKGIFNAQPAANNSSTIALLYDGTNYYTMSSSTY